MNEENQVQPSKKRFPYTKYVFIGVAVLLLLIIHIVYAHRDVYLVLLPKRPENIFERCAELFASGQFYE